VGVLLGAGVVVGVAEGARVVVSVGEAVAVGGSGVDEAGGGVGAQAAAASRASRRLSFHTRLSCAMRVATVNPNS